MALAPCSLAFDPTRAEVLAEQTRYTQCGICSYVKVGGGIAGLELAEGQHARGYQIHYPAVSPATRSRRSTGPVRQRLYELPQHGALGGGGLRAPLPADPWG